LIDDYLLELIPAIRFNLFFVPQKRISPEAYGLSGLFPIRHNLLSFISLSIISSSIISSSITSSTYLIKGIVSGYLYFSPFDVFIDAYIIRKNSTIFKLIKRITAVIPTTKTPVMFSKFKLLITKSLS
jgi:hypothetical protein